jgi:hypothetical protein
MNSVTNASQYCRIRYDRSGDQRDPLSPYAYTFGLFEGHRRDRYS